MYQYLLPCNLFGLINFTSNHWDFGKNKALSEHLVLASCQGGLFLSVAVRLVYFLETRPPVILDGYFGRGYDTCFFGMSCLSAKRFCPFKAVTYGWTICRKYIWIILSSIIVIIYALYFLYNLYLLFVTGLSGS